MKVVLMNPGEQPKDHVIDDSRDQLRALQGIVGGFIETAQVVPVNGGELVVYCDEDGRHHGREINCRRLTDGQLLVGTLVAVKVDAEGEQVSMTDLECALARGLFKSMRASLEASLAGAPK